MKTSFDEIKRMSFRALDAAGAPAGVDEDSAINTAWLEASGLKGLAPLANALDGTEPKERRGDLAPRFEGALAMVEAGGASAVFLGPGLIDLLTYLHAKHGAAAQINVTGLQHARFLIGFIGQARTAGAEFSLVPADPPADASDVDLVCGDKAGMPDWDQLEANRQDAYQQGIETPEADFARVYAYSRKILVPETEQSRLSGAGAGLTDND